ncbi:MAG: hypothetical protein LBG89_02450 [Rickettsiales bacterium]|jgi:hypothetical protein|nr:hypothetical protein [Rickettsiales bacterium]
MRIFLIFILCVFANAGFAAYDPNWMDESNAELNALFLDTERYNNLKEDRNQIYESRGYDTQRSQQMQAEFQKQQEYNSAMADAGAKAEAARLIHVANNQPQTQDGQKKQDAIISAARSNSNCVKQVRDAGGWEIFHCCNVGKVETGTEKMRDGQNVRVVPYKAGGQWGADCMVSGQYNFCVDGKYWSGCMSADNAAGAKQNIKNDKDSVAQKASADAEKDKVRKLFENAEGNKKACVKEFHNNNIHCCDVGKSYGLDAKDNPIDSRNIFIYAKNQGFGANCPSGQQKFCMPAAADSDWSSCFKDIKTAETAIKEQAEIDKMRGVARASDQCVQQNGTGKEIWHCCNVKNMKQLAPRQDFEIYVYGNDDSMKKNCPKETDHMVCGAKGWGACEATGVRERETISTSCRNFLSSITLKEPVQFCGTIFTGGIVKAAPYSSLDNSYEVYKVGNNFYRIEKQLITEGLCKSGPALNTADANLHRQMLCPEEPKQEEIAAAVEVEEVQEVSTEEPQDKKAEEAPSEEEAGDAEAVVPEPIIKPEPEPAPVVPFELKDMDSKLTDYNRWVSAKGEFIGAKRALVDSAFGVGLGIAGGVMVNSLMKSSQVDAGFKNIQCVIDGAPVAGWKDSFSIQR